MSQHPKTPASRSPASPEKKALLQAFDSVLKTQAEEREAERAAAEARRRNRGAMRLLMVVCVTFIVFTAVYLYIERPSWVFPTAPPPESVAVREASLRISLANAAQHVEQYHRKSGQWPTSLEEAGAYADGVRYERADDGYRLHGENGEIRVSLASGEPLGRFIGKSFEVIAGRVR